jgi:hypothetical protein
MPLALSKTERFRIVLNSDKDLDPQPAFIFRYITAEQQREVARKFDELDTVADAEKCFDGMFEMAATGLVGWENMFHPETDKEIPFDVKKFDNIIGSMELQEIILKLLAQHPNIDDKKKLDLQSESDIQKELAEIVDEKS